MHAKQFLKEERVKRELAYCVGSLLEVSKALTLYGLQDRLSDAIHPLELRRDSIELESLVH